MVRWCQGVLEHKVVIGLASLGRGRRQRVVVVVPVGLRPPHRLVREAVRAVHVGLRQGCQLVNLRQI